MMKNLSFSHCFKICIPVILFVTSFSLLAKDNVLFLKTSDVISQSYSDGKLDGSVRFYFSGQSTPKSLQLFNEVTTNRKTNAFWKNDVIACKWVMLSALIALQEGAKAQGANAVVNIESYYNKVVYKSPDQYECHVGTAMAGVVLKGSYAKIVE